MRYCSLEGHVVINLQVFYNVVSELDMWFKSHLFIEADELGIRRQACRQALLLNVFGWGKQNFLLSASLRVESGVDLFTFFGAVSPGFTSDYSICCMVCEEVVDET
jgi:hypothetical protein